MPAAGFVTLFVLTVSATSASASSGAAPPRPALPAGAHSPAPLHPRDSVRKYRSDELYSLRERRRIAAYLRMRLLELRETGLDRAADAVERRLPADVLLGPPPHSPPQ